MRVFSQSVGINITFIKLFTSEYTVLSDPQIRSGSSDQDNVQIVIESKTRLQNLPKFINNNINKL